MIVIGGISIGLVLLLVAAIVYFNLIYVDRDYVIEEHEDQKVDY